MEVHKEIKKMVVYLGGVQRTADLLECSRVAIYAWIKGKRVPKMDVFLELCELADKEIIIKQKEIDYFRKK